jgi:hypothetical protein
MQTPRIGLEYATDILRILMKSMIHDAMNTILNI